MAISDAQMHGTSEASGDTEKLLRSTDIRLAGRKLQLI